MPQQILVNVLDIIIISIDYSTTFNIRAGKITSVTQYGGLGRSFGSGKGGGAIGVNRIVNQDIKNVYSKITRSKRALSITPTQEKSDIRMCSLLRMICISWPCQQQRNNQLKLSIIT